MTLSEIIRTSSILEEYPRGLITINDFQNKVRDIFFEFEYELIDDITIDSMRKRIEATFIEETSLGISIPTVSVIYDCNSGIFDITLYFIDYRQIQITIQMELLKFNDDHNNFGKGRFQWKN